MNRKTVLITVIAVVCAVAAGILIYIGLHRPAETALPEKSAYSMAVYPQRSVAQRSFPLYDQRHEEDALMGTVACSDAGVTFSTGETPLPLNEPSYTTFQGNGSAADRFAGLGDSLEQLAQYGCDSFFVVCYPNGVYLLGGTKDGTDYLLPMWERIPGMEYLMSHFASPMTFDQVTRSMELWNTIYEGNPNVLENPQLWPNMAFDDPPAENWLFAPIKNNGAAAIHTPGEDPRNT